MTLFKKHGKSTIIINITNYAGSVQISSGLMKVLIFKIYLNQNPLKFQIVYRFQIVISPPLPPFDSWDLFIENQDVSCVELFIDQLLLVAFPAVQFNIFLFLLYFHKLAVEYRSLIRFMFICFLKQASQMVMCSFIGGHIMSSLLSVYVDTTILKCITPVTLLLFSYGA